MKFSNASRLCLQRGFYPMKRTVNSYFAVACPPMISSKFNTCSVHFSFLAIFSFNFYQLIAFREVAKKMVCVSWPDSIPHFFNVTSKKCQRSKNVLCLAEIYWKFQKSYTEWTEKRQWSPKDKIVSLVKNERKSSSR